MRISALVLSILLLLPATAKAGVSELRLGLLAHDVGVFGTSHEDGADGNVELLFDSPSFLEAVWAPRPHIGGSVNTSGNTSQVYAGLTWTWNASPVIFFELSLGGALHNGYTETTLDNRVELGSKVLFRESLSIGWRIGERHSVSLFFDHISNARLADRNEGMDNFGVRWGYRF